LLAKALQAGQLNAHIEKVVKQRNIPVHWWPSQGGGTDGAKLDFVKKKYANTYTGKGDHVYCVITDPPAKAVL
jgi:putative aminopeptidase FrvX